MADQRPPEPEDDDARDEQLADALAVTPLDEVTRRRLVASALDAADEPTAKPARGARSSRILAIAAALLFLVVAGGGLLLALEDSSTHTDTPTAAGSSADTAGDAQERAVPEAGSSTGDSASPFGNPPVVLPDLGSLATRSERRAVRDRVLAADPAFEGNAASGGPLASVVISCEDQLPDGTITAVGDATRDGETVTVVAVEAAVGTRAAYVIRTDPCRVTPLA